MTISLLCFGGPLNGELCAVRDHDHVVLAALPLKPGTVTEMPAAGRYDRREFGYHFPWLCDDAPLHSHCRWLGSCLVYEGYPIDRIERELTAVAILADWCRWI